MHMKGADHPVVVSKVLKWGWSKGDESVHREYLANQKWEELYLSVSA